MDEFERMNDSGGMNGWTYLTSRNPPSSQRNGDLTGGLERQFRARAGNDGLVSDAYAWHTIHVLQIPSLPTWFGSQHENVSTAIHIITPGIQLATHSPSHYSRCDPPFTLLTSLPPYHSQYPLD